jgi:hypothetical protein
MNCGNHIAAWSLILAGRWFFTDQLHESLAKRPEWIAD